MLGASGMLGHMVLRVFTQTPGCEALGTVRDAAALARLPAGLRDHAWIAGDLTREGVLEAALDRARPTLILNATGVLNRGTAPPETAIAVNALLPHRLTRLAAARGARLVHVSTDCVFAGTCGGYREEDSPDATDIYGRTKAMGELPAPALTLRASLIGPELGPGHGLLAWFLAQSGPIPGYTRAIFSGLPTIVFAEFLRDHVVPRPDLAGLYHLSAAPIAKHHLLRLMASAWPRDIGIVPTDRPVIDRSLDSSRLRAQTGWMPPAWPDLIAHMRAAA